MPSHSRALPLGFIAPCLPTSAPQPPSGALWLHESFRIIARKSGKRVKLYSRPIRVTLAIASRVSRLFNGRDIQPEALRKHICAVPDLRP
jgi:hypothetical protein